MSTDIASLTMQIDSTPVKEGTEALDDFAASGKKAEESVTSFEQAQMNARAAHIKAQEAIQKQRDTMVELDKGVQKLLDRYDPLGTKLRQLQSDFAMLDKAATAGALGKSNDDAVDKAYIALNTEIAKTQELMVKAGTAGGSAMMNLGLNTAYARRELMTLGREALSGDFSRMPQTFGSLLTHSNLLLAILNPITLGFVALAGAATVTALAFNQGEKELQNMNKTLMITGNYVGLTTGSMRELSQQVSNSGELTIGTAKNIVGQLVESGRVGAASIGAVSRLAEDFANATGRDVDKIAPDLIKLFSDPAKGAAELNQQMHFLTASEIDHIQHLQDIGQGQQAQIELAQKLQDFLPKHIDQLGSLERGWASVKKTAGEAWDSMLGIGRGKTTEEQQKDAQKYLFRLEASENPDGQEVSDARKRFNDLTIKLIAEQEAATAKALKSQHEKNEIEISDLAKKYSKYAQLVEIRDQLNRLEAWDTPRNSNESKFRSQAIDELTKKKDDILNPNDLIGKSDEGLRKKADDDIQRVNVWAGQDDERIKQAVGMINQIEDAYDRASGRAKAREDAQKKADKEEKAQFDAQIKYYEEQAKYENAAAVQMEKNTKESDRQDAQVKKFGETTKEHISQLNLEGKAYSETALEREMGIEALKLENEYTQAQIGLTETALEALRKVYDQRKAQLAQAVEAKVVSKQIEDQQKKEAENQQKIWDNLVRNIQHTLGDQLYEVMQGNFRNIGQAFFQMLQRMLADALAANLVQAMFGAGPAQGGPGLGLFGILFGAAAKGGGGVGGAAAISTMGVGSAKGSYYADNKSYFADGAAFHAKDNRPSYFADGDVVSSPTSFTFRGPGGALKPGVMGEAGDEAIMPLKRDSSGRLGVSGGGGKSTTIVYAPQITIDSRTDRSEVLSIVQRGVQQGNADLVERLQRGGHIE